MPDRAAAPVRRQREGGGLSMMRRVGSCFGVPTWPFLLLAVVLLMLAVLGVPLPPIGGRGHSVTEAEERAWSAAMAAWTAHGGFRYGIDSFLWLAFAAGTLAGSSVRGDVAFRDTLRTAAVLVAALAGLLVLPSVLLGLDIPLTNFDPTSNVTDFTDTRLFLPAIAVLVLCCVAVWDAIRFHRWRRNRRRPGRHAARESDQGSRRATLSPHS